MNAFEKWASGLLDHEDIQDMIHQREYQVSKILPAEELKARWEKIGYKSKVKPQQLKLF